MNQLIFADCLHVLKDFYKQYPDGFIDLIYIDPPFNSKRDYNVLFESLDMKDAKAQKEAFSDTWSNVSYVDTLNELQELNLDLHLFLLTLNRIDISKSAVSYLTTMAIRIYYMHKILKSTGTFYLHCDPTMSHYIKLLCDIIFGEKNFRNEIIWCYRGGGSSKVDFGKRHDVILRYSKSENYKFNSDPIRIPYQAEGKDRTDDAMWGKHKGTDKVYKPNPLGKIPEDWWNFNILNANDPERLGYPTQKPERLLERIIEASSNEKDIVADFFCGCGTSIAVAERLKRNWIGVDISHLAIKLIVDRLTKPYKNKSRAKVIRDNIQISGFPKDIASAKELATNTDAGRFGFQDWVIEVMLGGVTNQKKVADGGFDGYITFYKSEKEKGLILVEVKSGKVNVKNVREFNNVVNSRNSDLGIFVCFKEYVTKPMLLESKSAGYFETEHHNNKYDKIQIVTIEDLLEGRGFNFPHELFVTDTFKKATKKNDTDQENLELFK